jgi:hypothetical protein
MQVPSLRRETGVELVALVDEMRWLVGALLATVRALRRGSHTKKCGALTLACAGATCSQAPTFD